MPMEWFPITNTSEIGLVADIEAHRLPPNAFSSVTNGWFYDGLARKVEGYAEAYPGCPITPYALLAGRDTTNEPWWLVAGLTKVYSIYGGSYTNVTRQTASVDVDYAATAENVWTGGIMNSIGLLNNGIDAPQMWTSTGGKLAELSNWPASTTARSLRPFKNFIFALDVTKSGTRYPYLVKWSHPADPGAVPSSWDETDDTLDAGEYPLAETSDILIDGMRLKDSFIIYKETTTYRVTFVGSPYIFRFDMISDTSGLLSRNCAATVGNIQIALTQDDVVKTDGKDVMSIVDKRMRRRIINSISSGFYRRSFIAVDSRKNQVMICVPTGNAEFPNYAYIWNMADNTWGERSLPEISAFNVGGYSSASGTIDGDTGVIDDDTSPIDDVTAAARYTLSCSPSNVKLYVMNSGNQADGASYTCTFQRDDLDLGAAHLMKHIVSVRPHFYGTAGTVITVTIGYKMDIHGSITWGDAMSFTIGTTERLDTVVAGRYICWKASSSADDNWGIYDMNILIAGGGTY